MIPPDFDMGKVLTKITYLGLFMNIIVPVALIVGAMLLMNDSGGLSSAWEDKSILGLLFIIFLGLSIADGVATYFLRRILPMRLSTADSRPLKERFENTAVRIAILIFALNLSHCLYGIVLAALGAAPRVAMLFAAFSLVSYELFRPRESYLEQLLARLSGQPSP